MDHGLRAWRTTHRIPATVLAGLVVAAIAIAVPRGTALVASLESTGAPAGPANLAPNAELAARPGQGGVGRAIGNDDGLLPNGISAFDDRYAGIAKLDPALLRALREATTRASRDGANLLVTSGWRSHAYQEALFREAVSQYGSETAAARWVANPGTSAHETGDAVDIAPAPGAAWLARHGASYGLCQTYANEPWHFELRPAAVHDRCPQMDVDARGR